MVRTCFILAPRLDRRFCEATIDELLSNPHISRNPVTFFNDDVTECFFRDALRLANIDGCIHPLELHWLRETAYANGRSDQWLESIIRESPGDPSAPLDIQKHL